MSSEIIENNIDDHVDEELYQYLNLDDPKSFFLFAGAGSGKTKSLVETLKRLKDKYEQRLKLNRQQIAVITYTNAACDEIKNRLEHNPIFSVSTIHSFVWKLIQNYPFDIKGWLRVNLKNEIAELQQQQLTGRASKASVDRAKKIEAKTKRLEKLDAIKKFIYNPDGDNNTKDSLNHSEVINIGAYFLLNKPLMQLILIRKHPILLIDESQDTKKELIDAFFDVQKNNSKHFSLGLFGDTMQRIYSDGKENLGRDLPSDWLKPVKKMNHRCPKRIITLINKIRYNVDAQEQLPRVEKEEGIVRFFIGQHSQDKIVNENAVRQKMAEITNDSLWNGENAEVKTLILEHHMSAKRMGFSELFEPLYKIEKLKTGLLDGSLSGIRFFTQYILPLVIAKQNNDTFGIARTVRQYSPLFKKDTLKKSSSQMDTIKESNSAVTLLFSLWKDNNTPKLIDIINNVANSGLFIIPESLIPISTRNAKEQEVADEYVNKIQEDLLEENIDDDKDEIIDAWDKALSTPFTQIVAYNDYILDKSKFATHQGVKGLQFPRVMVILDDEEARGFLFSYEKLVGAKSPTESDIKNISEGKETSIDRTLRLFYVACSRAQESLAIVIYTSSPLLVKTKIKMEGWFDEEEIELL